MFKKQIENERKFLIKELPKDFHTYLKSTVKQWYLTKPFDDVSVRIRLYDDNRCYLDIKKGYGIIKEKIGKKCNFNDIQEYTNNAYLLEKIRYKKHIDDYLIIIDFFQNGLKLVEIESKNYNTINNFKPLYWWGEEVTDNIEYYNNVIAYNNFKY